MRTKEEFYSQTGERIFTQDEVRPAAAPVNTKNAFIGVLIGICGGWLASWVVGGEGIFHYLITGVMGSFVASAVFNKLGINLGIRNDIGRDIATATIGAIIVMMVARLLT
jgi:uncharacterized membrane protein YeaQ/YmgE (transglycosylase-associated protein family)